MSVRQVCDGTDIARICVLVSFWLKDYGKRDIQIEETDQKVVFIRVKGDY